MKIRNWLTTAFGLSALGAFSMLASVYVAPQAYAQSLSHARPVTSAVGLSSTTFTTKICLLLATSECITSHGGGNRVTIQTSNQAIFHSLNIVGNDVQLEDAGGKCLREFADATVGLAFGGCDSTNLHEYWALAFSGARTTFQNVASGDFMGTFGTNSGLDVFGGPPESGFFTGWTS
jgi:hypothetical protein